MKKDYFDALWKYEHALDILGSFPLLQDTAAVILCNAAQCCLKLGNAERSDVIMYKDEILWYGFCSTYSSMALKHTTDSEIIIKVKKRIKTISMLQVPHMSMTKLFAGDVVAG